MHRVTIKPRAERELDALPEKLQLLILERIGNLAENPRPAGSVKIVGTVDIWRVRQGDYRIVYQVSDSLQLVVISKIGHRREVYQ